ncbi:hypothetical protein KEM54_001366 [Ascosphaera aggregata]|nr:hypothetical protein KEM54_001366 [Ascosphaera aggregata]
MADDKRHSESSQVTPQYANEKATTNTDDDRLAEMGYTQELQRNFSVLSLLGVGFSLTNSWFGISTSLITGISSGGPVLVMYGIPWSAFISACVGSTLSELTSSMPNAGGQYYWAQQLAAPKWSALASYLTGYFAWAGAIFSSASTSLGLAQIVVGLYQLNNPEFEPQAWHSVVTVATVTLWISLLSFFVILVTIPAKADFHQSAKFVFATFINNTGWKSSGMAYIVGLINPNWVFACLDSATHMAEEVGRPERSIPIAIMGTVAIGFVTAWFYCMSMFFSLRDFQALLKSPTGVPILELYHQALGTRAGAVVLGAFMVATGCGCLIAGHTWQARLCWSFARDRGLPGHQWLGKISKRAGVPLAAHFFSCVIVGFVGLLFLGSSTAFNSMVTACISLLYVSYAIPVICLLLKGRNTIPRGPFWMGKLGYFTNWVLLLWTLFTLVVFSFPEEMPATTSNMNYVCVVYFIIVMIIALDWVFRGRRSFRRFHVEDKVRPVLSN